MSAGSRPPLTTKQGKAAGTAKVRGTYRSGPNPAIDVNIALMELLRLHGRHIKTLKIELMPPLDFCLDYIHKDADKPDKKP